MRFVDGQRRGEKVWNGVEDVVERWVRMVRGWNWIKRRSSVCCGYWSLWRASSYRPLPTHSREKLAPRRPCERMRTTTPSRIIRVSTHYTCYNRREPPIQISSLEIFLSLMIEKRKYFPPRKKQYSKGNFRIEREVQRELISFDGYGSRFANSNLYRIRGIRL